MLFQMGRYPSAKGLFTEEHPGEQGSDYEVHAGVFRSHTENQGDNHGNTEINLFKLR